MEEITLEEVKRKIIEFSNDNKVYPSARMIMKELKDELPNRHKQYVKLYGMTLREIIDSCNITEYKYIQKPFTYSDDEMIAAYKEMARNLGRVPRFSDIDDIRKNNRHFPTAHTLSSRFGSIEKLADICGLYKGTEGVKYKSSFLISELKRFYNEFNRIPNQKDFNGKIKNYPSRKTFTNHFGKFNDALRAAGFDIKDKVNYSKDDIISELRRYYSEFNRQPTSEEFDIAKGYPSRHMIRKFFESWNSALLEAGFTPVVTNYTDEELESIFRDFVKEHGRIPRIHEFNNNNKYPSFWCYQNRFGSWNKAVESYGYDVNEGASGTHYSFENGEVCKSTYEYDVSKWLRENNISYLRNLPYRDLLEWYDGRKDCDYVILYNGEFIFLEVAGLYTHREKKSSMEKDYIKRFDHKVENLLSQFNYKVLYPNDFKEKAFDEMFSFLFDIPRPEWLSYEEIYQGI